MRVAIVYFFFNDTATTEIYTLSLHDALPISPSTTGSPCCAPTAPAAPPGSSPTGGCAAAPPSCTTSDRKSTRLNSSHSNISYAVFCLKTKSRDEEEYGPTSGGSVARTANDRD